MSRRPRSPGVLFQQGVQMRHSIRFAALAALLAAAPVRAGGLDLVPADAFGFVHVRAAELWKSDSMKDVRTVLDKAGPQAIQAFDARFLPTPSSVSEITMVALLEPGGKSPPSPVLLVTTKKAIDRDALV